MGVWIRSGCEFKFSQFQISMYTGHTVVPPLIPQLVFPTRGHPERSPSHSESVPQYILNPDSGGCGFLPLVDFNMI